MMRSKLNSEQDIAGHIKEWPSTIASQIMSKLNIHAKINGCLYHFFFSNSEFSSALKIILLILNKANQNLSLYISLKKQLDAPSQYYK